MIKQIKKVMILLIAVILTVGSTCFVSASQATSYTYTIDQRGHWNRTQDAYLPDQTITDLGLKSPDDLFIDTDNMIYIADAGNRRIVKYNINLGKTQAILEHAGFSNPRGVFVTEEGDIYIADSGAKKIFRFSKDMDFISEFGKPNSPSFANTPFEPLRIAVDNGGNMYIVGEGVYNGVIQLAPSGEFLGYFTVNKAKLSLVQGIQNMIFTRAQLSNLVPRVPTTFSNLFIDHAGIVYTTTMGTNVDGLKKHNTAGGNMFKTQDWVADEMTDVYVDHQGIIYTSVYRGYINIYSKAGELIFAFGANVVDLDVAGLFTTLPSIAVDRERNIWALDGTKGYLQSFRPTDYTNTVYNATGLYEEGRYDEALEQWSEVLKLNQMSVMAHNGLGKALLHEQRYEEAMHHFEVAGNRTYYSEAFWEVRNQWIQGNMEIIVGVLVLLWIVSFLLKKLDRKRRVKGLRNRIINVLSGIPVIKDFIFSFQLSRHPVNQYYNLKTHRKGSALGATVVYLLIFIVYMIYKTSKGFIYQLTEIEDMDIGAIVIGFFIIIILFIVCNYLATSINDGDGSFKQVYMIPAFGSLPLMISMGSITLLSYFLTYNETFILTIILWIGILWTIILIFVGLMTVHDYTFKETILSIIITVVFMIIVAIVVLVIIIMWHQLWKFILSIGKEMTRNVLK